MSIKKLFTISILIAALLLVVILVFTITLGYENTISDLITLFKYEKYEDKIKLLLSKNKFHYIQGAIFILILALLIILKFSNAIIYHISFYFKDLISSLLKSIKILRDTQNIFIIVLPILAILYYAVNLPVSYDEAWTYLNFSSRNFIISLTYYPAPNNHILHSLLTNLTHFIFPNYPLFSLRLPTVVVTLMTFLIAPYSLKKHYTQNVSIACVGIFSVVFMGIYYSYMSRGYALIVLFFIASFHFALNIIKNPGNTRDWVWLTLFSILGFFTIPSYLYAYVIINAMLFFLSLKRSGFINQIKFSFITIVSVAILYLPIIIVSGLHSLSKSSFVAPINREVVFSKLPEFLFQTLEAMFGLNGFLVVSLVIISLLLLLRNKDWVNLNFFIVFLIGPPLLLLTHSVIPFGRTFNYYGFILVLLFCISIQFLLEKIKMRTLLIVIICLQVLFIINFNNKIYNAEKYSIVAKEINTKISNEKMSYLVNSQLFDAYLLYYLKVENITNSTVDYFSAINMNADTITKYKYIVIDRSSDKTKKRNPVYSNEFFNVYE